MIRFLEAQGFSVARARGSHHVMEKGNLHTTIPVHGNDPLRIGTLHGILRDIEMSPAAFARLWAKR